MNKTVNESKTAAPPAEPTMEELEALTNPGNGQLGVAPTPDPELTAIAQAAAAKVASGVHLAASPALAQSIAEAPELKAFEMPAGKIAAGEDFNLGKEIPLDADQQRNIAIAAAAARERQFMEMKEAGMLPPNPIDVLRLELKAEIADLRDRFAPADGFLYASMRGTIYCPECGKMLDGGAATGVAHSPYVHPFESGGAKPCQYMGHAFEKPTVKIRHLGPAAKLKPRMVG